MLDLEPCIHSLGLQSVSKLQWGAAYSSGYNTFPIAFSSFCTMSASSEYSYDGSDCFVQKFDLTKFNARVTRTDFARGWIAIGK